MNRQSIPAARPAVTPSRTPSPRPALDERPEPLGAHQAPADAAVADSVEHGPLGQLWVVQGTELHRLPVAGLGRPGEGYFVDLLVSDQEIDRLFDTFLAPMQRPRVDPRWTVLSLPFVAAGSYAAARGDYRLLGAWLLTATGVDQAVAQRFGRSVLFGFAGPNARGVVLGAYVGLALRRLMRLLPG